MLFAVFFPLVALIFFSFSLIFVSLIDMCLEMFLLKLILHGILCTSLTWVTVYFPILGDFLL